MRKALKWRYYCDFCKKVGGNKFHMVKHEKACTANKDRICGMCGRVGISEEAKKVLYSFCAIGDEYSEISTIEHEAALVKLRESVDHCPACMLAALKATDRAIWGFDFKQERDSWWKEHPRNTDDLY